MTIEERLAAIEQRIGISPTKYYVAVHEAVTVEAAPKTARQRLFEHLAEEHNIIALETELFEIIDLAVECKKEADTPEPDPYQVDWKDAPEWADSHAFDNYGDGYWYGAIRGKSSWFLDGTKSTFALPAGLDWRLSKRLRPVDKK